ncbi:MAG: alpha-amylase [Calditrichaeota bacterium]|nr:alpha-amylase [Calditrichota bacterium]
MHLKKVIIGLLILSFSFCSKKEINYEVPQWAKTVVWYQIFPERFRNGDPSNDPSTADIQGAWPFGDDREIRIVPWTSDWYKLQPWEQDGKGFYYHAQRRRYGGDLQGVLNKLDYLQNLGINAIYFNPLFEAPSLHKYDAVCYHHIDDNFGPEPDGDKKIMRREIPDDPSTWEWTAADKLFLKLIDECHKRGIKVIIDGVFNHVGVKFFAFEDLKKNQQKSKYKNWFTVKSWDDPNTPEDEFDYECWANVRSLPEIREGKSGFDRGAWRYMRAAIHRWMDPNNDGDPSDGIDGWRLDVAEKVTRPSWVKFRKFVRSVNPQAYLSGEVWWEKFPVKMFNAAGWLQGDMFDAVMNYRFANAVTKFFINKNKKITASAFDQELEQIRKDYPAEVNFVLQNLMDSHDTDRLGSMIVNPDRIYGHNNTLQSNKNYNVRKPHADEIKIQKLIVLFQMTYIGAPMIFYGDEAGMWGASDPDERKPMLWQDMTYEDEVSHPFGLERPRDKNVFNEDLFRWYQGLIKIRRQHSALMLGNYRTILADGDRDIFVFERATETEKIVVAVNNAERIQHVRLNLPGKYWMDLISGDQFIGVDDQLEISLDSKSGVILIPGMETRLAQENH